MAIIKCPCLICEIHLSGVSKIKNEKCIFCNDRVIYDRKISEWGVFSRNGDHREAYTFGLGPRYKSLRRINAKY